MVTFTLNGSSISADAAIDTPLIDVIRDTAGATGTKLACGAGVCGACTVLVGWETCRQLSDACDPRRRKDCDDGRRHRS